MSLVISSTSKINPESERDSGKTMALTVAKSALEAIREKGLGGFMRMIREEGFMLVLRLSYRFLSSSALINFFWNLPGFDFVRSR